MNLYELTQNAAYLQQLLEDGDIDEQTFNDSLESLMIEDKVENICKVIRNLEAQAAAFKEEAERLAKKKKTAENGVNRLKESLVNHLQTTKSEKITAGLFTVTIGTSKAVEVTSEKELPDYVWTPQPPRVNNAAITEAIKSGVAVPGAALTESYHVRIK